MEANVTVTIDAKEVLDLSVLLVELAGKTASILSGTLNTLPSEVANFGSSGKRKQVFVAGLSRAEKEVSQVIDKIQQARRIMEGLEQHSRTPTAEAESLEGFANFLGRLEAEGPHIEGGNDEPTEES